jgi:hypothetical protein
MNEPHQSNSFVIYHVLVAPVVVDPLTQATPPKPCAADVVAVDAAGVPNSPPLAVVNAAVFVDVPAPVRVSSS